MFICSKKRAKVFIVGWFFGFLVKVAKIGCDKGLRSLHFRTSPGEIMFIWQIKGSKVFAVLGVIGCLSETCATGFICAVEADKSCCVRPYF